MNVKRILLLSFMLGLFYGVDAQGTFTSIEQAKYRIGDSLTYISGSRYYIEISFHTQEGYILLKNKDTGYENRYINVVPGAKKNTWRAYSKTTDQACLFSFITNNEGMCIAIDDQTIVTLLKVRSAKSHSK